MDDDAARLLGRAIRRHRIERSWRQSELGAYVHSSQARISRIERGVARLDCAEREAFERAFGLRQGELLREIGRVERPMEDDGVTQLIHRVAALENSILALRKLILYQATSNGHDGNGHALAARKVNSTAVTSFETDLCSHD